MLRNAKAVAYETMLHARARLNQMVDARWDRDPLAKAPRTTSDEYQRLWSVAKANESPAVAAVEQETGFAICREWLDNLALHTQIVKKKSDLAYFHGRLLYSLLRRYLAESTESHFTVFETGTARGFSALCMAKALEDSGNDGRIITLDVLPHLTPMYWNCIDDNERKKSRAELLEPWAELARRIVFVQGDTLYFAPRLGLDRIHFAFLDAQHIRKNVMAEFAVVECRQRSGDLAFFDDVTPALFPGVVSAVNDIEARGDYSFRRLPLSDQRAYAWGVRR